MHKPDPKVVKYMALAAGVLLLAGGAMILQPMYTSWREEQTLRKGHITYVRFPCTAMLPAGSCPAYTLDVFGDGTVIYQSASNTRIKGSYRYHVDGQAVRDYMRDAFVSTYWTTAMPAGPDRQGGSCLVIMQMQHQVKKNGCLKWRPGSDQAMNDGSVSDTVAQLEAISQVNSLARGDGGTQALMRSVHRYKAQKISLAFQK
ncbi:MAG: hypothetical protein JF615_06820 [Asticcacaulis sp.]|nr:hypothetical protein [Asticcacaulis sp.]